jgi:FkbM family methyltransferase
VSTVKDLVKSLVPKPLWSFLRVLRIQKSIYAFKNYTVDRIYHGEELRVHIQDEMARGWYDKEMDPLYEVDFLKAKGVLKSGSKIFDLGAHQGVVAMILARTVGESGRVLALEANSHNFKVANLNAKANKIFHLSFLHSAISNVEGTVLFNKGLNGSVTDENGEWGKEEVPCVSIDYLINKYFKPDLIYLDVEGFEVVVLKGIKESDLKSTSWFIEVHGEALISQFGGTVSDVLSYFKPSDFDLYMALDGDKFIPLDFSSPWLKDRFFLIAIPKNR